MQITCNLSVEQQLEHRMEQRHYLSRDADCVVHRLRPKVQVFAIGAEPQPFTEMEGMSEIKNVGRS